MLGAIYMILFPQMFVKNLYSIRVWHCQNYIKDWHSNTEIFICLKGQLDVELEGTRYHLEKDDVLIMLSCEAHESFCSNPDTDVILIAFGYDLLGYDYRKLQDISFEKPFFNLNDSSVPSPLIEPLARIKERLLNPKEDVLITRWGNRSDLYAISAYLMENRQNKRISKERQTRIKQQRSTYDILKYISEHYRETITLDQAADIVGYDKSYFCRQFRKITGMTFHRYLNSYRVTIACQLLWDENILVSAVAEQAGFASPKMMSRLFQDILGVSPTEYRKLSRGEKVGKLPL